MRMMYSERVNQEQKNTTSMITSQYDGKGAVAASTTMSGTKDAKQNQKKKHE